MRLMGMLRRVFGGVPDFLPGRYDLAMLLVLAGAGYYVHVKDYREDAMGRAGAAVAAAFAMSKAGEVRGEMRGFQRGYTTYNPDLHRDDFMVPFDARNDLPIEPPDMPEPPGPVELPMFEVEPPEVKSAIPRALAEMTARELRDLARQRGHHGSFLNYARKRELIDLLR